MGREVRPAMVSGFLERLGGLDAVLRAVTDDAALRVAFDVRGAGRRRAILDLRARPAAVRVDDGRGGEGCDVVVAADALVLHRVFLDEVAPSQAVGRRQLLLRGSAAHLARLIPLFDFAPALYREHLSDAGWPGFERPERRGPRRPLADEEAVMPDENGDRGGERGAIRAARLERWACRAVSRAAFGAGWAVGVARHRVLPSLSLFEVLEAMMRGLDASTPPRHERAE